MCPVGIWALVPSVMDDFKTFLLESFEVSLMGDANFFLGLRIRRQRRDWRLKLDQHAFIQTILDRFNVSANARAVHTPLSSTKNLVPNKEPIENVIPKVRRHYQSIVESLMYLMLGTRPDLAYSVGKLAHFSSNPSSHHICALDRVLIYLRNTRTQHFDWYPEDNDAIHPSGSTDADFAGDTSDRKSTAGYYFWIGGTIFSWSSKESTIATSTTEAEYIALYLASRQAAWIHQFYKQIGLTLDLPIEIWCDSQPALQVAKREEAHRKVKHLDVEYHSIREQVNEGQIELKWIKSENNVADILTKSVPTDVFRKHRDNIGLSAEGEYKFDSSGDEDDC